MPGFVGIVTLTPHGYARETFRSAEARHWLGNPRASIRHASRGSALLIPDGCLQAKTTLISLQTDRAPAQYFASFRPQLSSSASRNHNPDGYILAIAIRS